MCLCSGSQRSRLRWGKVHERSAGISMKNQSKHTPVRFHVPSIILCQSSFPKYDSGLFELVFSLHITSLSAPNLSHTTSFSRISSIVALNTCRNVRHVPYKRAPKLLGWITKEWTYSSGSPRSALYQGHALVVMDFRVKYRQRSYF